MKEALPERDLFGARPHEYIVPVNAYRGVCRSCGAAMAFVPTKAGSKMPVALSTLETRDGVDYALPHFIDCPQAKEWSKK